MSSKPGLPFAAIVAARTEHLPLSAAQIPSTWFASSRSFFVSTVNVVALAAGANARAAVIAKPANPPLNTTPTIRLF